MVTDIAELLDESKRVISRLLDSPRFPENQQAARQWLDDFDRISQNDEYHELKLKHQEKQWRMRP
jgi:hypothetical protein